jgi:hypothetical protein
MRAIRLFVAEGFLGATMFSAQGENPILVLAEAPSACAVLSRLAVEEASGSPVAEGVARLSTRTVASCQFNGERGGRVVILVRWVPANDWVAEQASRMNRGVQLGTYRRVPRIGEQSFLYAIRGEGAVLCIFGAGFYLQISVLRMGEDSHMAAILEKLAISTLAQLRFTASAGPATLSRRPGSHPPGVIRKIHLNP